MKIILLFTILITSLFANQTQIVLGTFSKYESAKEIQLQLNEIIEKDTKLKNLLKNKNIKGTIKKLKNHYIVSIEPFNDLTVQTVVLSKIKTTKFSDAYVIKINSQNKIVQKQTSKTKEVISQNSAPVLIKKINTKNQPIQNENIVDKYFKEIIAFILILILSIFYLYLRKNNHNKKDMNNVNYDVLNNETDEIKEDSIAPSTLNKEFKQYTQKTDEIIEDSIAPSTLNKEFKQYTQKTKDDFKDFANSRIMIAEDNLINQKVICGLLSESGIQIVVVNDGLEAINYLKKDSNFSIILMDVRMPNMDGFEATRLIRQNDEYNHITVVSLSGDTAPDDINKMKDAGMQEHLEKPLRINALYSILAAFSFKKKNIIVIDKNIEINNQQELYTAIGIEICGGDENFYKEILNDFIKDYSNSILKIQNHIHNNKFLEADKLLLDIGSIVANIGATNIENLTKELKLSIKTPEDKKHILLFKKYAKHYEALKNEVKDYLKPL
ncbi:MAG: response regulator [Sulfurimonas sp.]|nr:response regulator [Sulfurimonas sp.]